MYSSDDRSASICIWIFLVAWMDETCQKALEGSLRICSRQLEKSTISIYKDFISLDDERLKRLNEFDSPNIITSMHPNVVPQRDGTTTTFWLRPFGCWPPHIDELETVSGFPWPMGPPMKCWKRDVNFCWIGRS